MCCLRACSLFLCNTKPARNIGHYFVSKQFHDCIFFFIMDLVNQFVYSIVLYLLARNESFHETSATIQYLLHTVCERKCLNNVMPIFVLIHDESFIQDGLFKARDSNDRHTAQYHVGVPHAKA